jgi:hypothetical protein
MLLRNLAVPLAALLLCLTGCDKEEAKYVRPSPGCKCAEKKGGSKCQCNHCMGEKAQGKSALCYCDQGGCSCGAKTTKCACGHCQGEDDDPKCACKK